MSGIILSLSELTQILGAQIKTLSCPTLSADEREMEIKKADKLAQLATQYTNTVDIMLRAEKALTTGKISEFSSVVKIL